MQTGKNVNIHHGVLPTVFVFANCFDRNDRLELYFSFNFDELRD